MRNLIIAAFSGLVFSGCYQRINPEILNTYSNDQLCWGAVADKANGDVPLNELVKRGLIIASDVPLIKAKTIRAGMPECALIIMKGSPNDGFINCGSVNTSGGAYGSRKQYVYRPCGRFGGNTTYVYIESGIVTSWQNW